MGADGHWGHVTTPVKIGGQLPLGKVRAGVTFGGPNKIMWRVEVSLEVVDGFDAFFVVILG